MRAFFSIITISLGLASVGFSQTTNDYPKAALKNAGYSTPDSALETWTWAMTKGDKEVILQSLTPETKKDIEKLLAGKTEEQMKADAAKGAAKISGYTIQKREVISADQVVVHITLIGSDEVLKMDVKKIGSDWKIAGPYRD